MRLNQYLARAGVCSRREADKLIQSKLIMVNGQIISTLGAIVNLTTDHVEFRLKSEDPWQSVKIVPPVVYALHKPVGFTTTSADPHAQKIVTDLVPPSPKVFPVGRLDKNTSGLLLLTNDGALSTHLTLPKHHVIKTYTAIIQMPHQYDQTKLAANLNKLERGIWLDGMKTAPAEFRLISQPQLPNLHLQIQIKISEGKNRQIRRMLQKIGLNVVQLTRTAIGHLELAKLHLQPGQFVILNQTQINLLHQN